VKALELKLEASEIESIERAYQPRPHKGHGL
jgi:hypothetical protein